MAERSILEMRSVRHGITRLLGEPASSSSVWYEDDEAVVDAAEENDRDGELFEIVAEEALHFTEAESFDMPILIIHADELAHEA